MAKMKVPKKVVGVKIPKKVRKRANKALKMADSPLVREAAVAALGAAGAAKGVKGAGNGRGRSGPDRFDAEVLVEAIRDAALDGVRRFILGFEEGLRKAADAASEAADAVEERAKGDARPAPAPGAARPKPPRRTKRRPAKAAAAPG